MYTVMSFVWPDGFPSRPVLFGDDFATRRFPQLFLADVSVKGVGRVGSIAANFRGGIRNGTSPSGFEDFFVSLVSVLGATAKEGQGLKMIFPFELGRAASDEDDDRFLMMKYLTLLRYCRIEPGPDLVPHIIRETFVGAGPLDCAALAWGPYLFASVLTEMSRKQSAGPKEPATKERSCQ